jgi:ribosome modulation factor
MRNASERLILATQTFSLETVWMQGYETAKNDRSDLCPYSESSKEHHYWNEGYDAAVFGEKPLFPEYAVESNDINLVPSNNKRHPIIRAFTIIGTGIAVAIAIDLAA